MSLEGRLAIGILAIGLAAGCGGYSTTGTFIGRYSVQDDNSEWSSIDFRSIVE